LGVSPALGFYDVYSISDPDLLAFVPRPAYALIFIAPHDIYNAARDDENDALPEYTGSGPDEAVLWFKQSIGHTCGTMASLHAVSNGGAKAYILPGSGLDNLLKEAVPLKTNARANLLYDSPILEAAHQRVAQTGDSEVCAQLRLLYFYFILTFGLQAPPAEDENYFHFIAFVKGDDGNLWELNGGMKGPVNRGKLEPDEDALSERALDLGVRTFMPKGEKAKDVDVRFSIVALAPSLD
jgi:ubiquitin carboxyl-terminal hydrolase L3